MDAEAERMREALMTVQGALKDCDHRSLGSGHGCDACGLCWLQGVVDDALGTEESRRGR